VEVKGEHYMTPQDFLECVTEESPRRMFIAYKYWLLILLAFK